eukprot:293148-Hanusia_phi.AAC.1
MDSEGTDAAATATLVKTRRDSERETFDVPPVLVKSTLATGHFSRQELEAMCNSVEPVISVKTDQRDRGKRSRRST